jgi:hypothetical protein
VRGGRGAHAQRQAAADLNRPRAPAAAARRCALHFCAQRGCIRAAHITWWTKSKDNAMVAVHNAAWKARHNNARGADGACRHSTQARAGGRAG